MSRQSLRAGDGLYFTEATHLFVMDVQKPAGCSDGDDEMRHLGFNAMCVLTR